MAETLKRWNGSAWVAVTSINRMNVSGGGGELLAPTTFSRLATPASPVGGWTYLTMISTSSIATF